MTPDTLANKLSTSYPANVTCWSQATDEVRDMSRYARIVLELDESFATDFRELHTPAQWNEKGVGSIVAFYRIMSDKQRLAFLKLAKGLY